MAHALNARIHLGAGTHTLAMQGHVWDLNTLERPQLSTTAAMLSEAMGLQQQPTRPGRRHRNRPRHRKDPAS